MEYTDRGLRLTPQGPTRCAGPARRHSADACRLAGLAGTLAVAFAGAFPAVSQEAAPPAREAWRLRIVNQARGTVELSGDGGITWEPLGSVVAAARLTTSAGSAYSAAAPGTVAGVSPTALTLRIPAEGPTPRLLRVLSAGERENDASISTDLLPGTGPFRSVAPVPGSPVLLERDGLAAPLPGGYAPKSGDRIVVVVKYVAQADRPRIEFENKEGGAVISYESGALPRLLGRVRRPLSGIGRYAGTDRAGAGTLLAWGPTLLVVGTAGTARRLNPAGEPLEERGGFIIQPAEPALMGSTHPASQVLVEAVEANGIRPPVSPLFFGGYPLSSVDPLETQNTRIEVRIDGGPWEACPDLRDSIPNAEFLGALRRALGPERRVETGITHFRIVAAGLEDSELRRRIRLAGAPAEAAPQRGVVTLIAGISGQGIREVEFRLNGRLAKITNVPPYSWTWDTSRYANGEHLVEIRGSGMTGEILATVRRRVLVDN